MASLTVIASQNGSNVASAPAPTVVASQNGAKAAPSPAPAPNNPLINVIGEGLATLTGIIMGNNTKDHQLAR